MIRVEVLERAVLDSGWAPAGSPAAFDVVVLPYFEDERPLGGLAGLVDWRTQGRLSEWCREGPCTGRQGEATLGLIRTGLPATRVVLYGLGPLGSYDLDTARTSGRALAELILGMRPSGVLAGLPDRPADGAAWEATFMAMVEVLRGRPAAIREVSKGSIATAELALVRLHAATPWWFVTEQSQVTRLRRLLQGPPRQL